MSETERHLLSERSGITFALGLFERWGKAFKENKRVCEYYAHYSPHPHIRFVTEVVMLDIEIFTDSTVSMTRTYTGIEAGTVKTKDILRRARIKPGSLTRLLKRNLPLTKKVA
jgi:hypothetical protein